ncbi:MAG: DUF3333 domain-containing protein, partial [Pseudomonadota bacterium]
MSEATGAAVGAPAKPTTEGGHKADVGMKARNRAEKRFQAYGIIAILIGLFFLVWLLFNIIGNGMSAFTQTYINIPITLNQDEVDAAEASFVKTSRYREIITNALAA